MSRACFPEGQRRRTNDPFFQDLGYTIQVRWNILAADSSRARTLYGIAVNLVAFIRRLTNVSIERRQGEARKTTKKGTKRDTREYGAWEKFSHTLTSSPAFGGSRVVGGSFTPLEASFSRDRHGRLSESFLSFYF